ncbi:GerW family sporulation protein [Candidatus Latescibacterota bacterium]
MDISKIAKDVMEQIKETVRSETVVGEPVQAEDSVIIPVSKVTFGFGVGGGENGENNEKGSGGGAGCGATIEPVAFVVVSKGKAQILPLKSREATLTRVIDLVPTVLDALKGFKSDAPKKSKDKDSKAETKEPKKEKKK